MHSRQPNGYVEPAARTAAAACIHALPGRAETAWPATLLCRLARGDRVLVPANGALALLWAAIATCAGLTVEVLEDPTEAALARRLGADRFGAIKAVLVLHGHTDPAAARRALDESFHDALLCVDASAVPRPDLAARVADVVIADPRAGLANLAACPSLTAE